MKLPTRSRHTISNNHINHFAEIQEKYFFCVLLTTHRCNKLRALWIPPHIMEASVFDCVMKNWILIISCRQQEQTATALMLLHPHLSTPSAYGKCLDHHYFPLLRRNQFQYLHLINWQLCTRWQNMLYPRIAFCWNSLRWKFSWNIFLGFANFLLSINLNFLFWQDAWAKDWEEKVD